MHLSVQHIALGIALLAALIAGWFAYRFMDNLRHLEETVKELTEHRVIKEEAKVIAHEELKEIAQEKVLKRQVWSALQSKFKDAVPQIFAQINEFNWVEPYKTPTQQEVTGSGFFINKEGELITNAHVIDQAIAINIQIPSVGKRRFAVEVIGISPERDLALMRLKKGELEALKKEMNVKELPYLPMGDSDAINRADKIMVLGYPLGQQGLKSATGVVSGREHLMGQYFIQISAPINKGNSGGPSLDNKGFVVGVNTAVIAGAQNVGYIIPISDVRLFLDQLKTLPQSTIPHLLRRPYLGVIFNNANENLTSFLGNPQPGGLYVVDIYKGSPLDKAGLKAGDMIYKIDNYAVDTSGEMSVPWSKEDRISIVDYVSRLKIGHKISLDYYRKGTFKKTNFILTQSEPPIRRVYPGYEKIDYEVLAGYVFMPITMNHIVLLAQYAPDLMQYADLKKPVEPALLITHVMLNSPASRTRTVGAGGIIAEVNGITIKTLKDFRNAVPASIKTGYLTIKTTDNQFVALSLREIMEDEPRLAATYFYPFSESYKNLRDQVGTLYGPARQPGQIAAA